MPVSHDDDKATPMPSSRSLPYHRSLSSVDVQGLLRGFKSLSMDDTWSFFAENGIVHVHRSWTGEEIFSFRVSSFDNGSGEACDVRVNNTYPDDKDAIRILDLLFDTILPQHYAD
jgi:hypothetical protein